jgi:cell division protein ZapA
MEEGYVGINLLVNGISYPLVVLRSEEPYYRQAARLINERLLKYKDTFAAESGEKLMTMVAIDIAFRRLQETDPSGMSRISKRLMELTKEIDDTIE